MRTLLPAFLCLFLIAAQTQQNSITVVVLGIAQDGGVPQIGCTQQLCKTQHRFVSSLAIIDGSRVYLVDATPDLREQYSGLIQRHPGIAQRNLFDGIFLTHAHMGHYTGLIYLGKESTSTKNVPVYGSSEMVQYLKQNQPWSFLESNGNIELHSFTSNTAIPFDHFRITPVPVPHRKEFTDTHGFLITGPSRTLLYISDIDSWDPIKNELSGWIKKSDYALLDGTFYSGDELPGRNMTLVPHPTVESSIEFFNSMPPFACKLYFTHFNHTNPLLDPVSAQSKRLAATSYRIAAEWQEFTL